MMIKFRLILFFMVCSYYLLAQDSVKITNAVRISNAPVIDGNLNDGCWTSILAAKDFRQLQPYNGNKASLPSEVKIAYDDKAIYVGAMLYDQHPDSIMKQYTPRDEINVSDYFGIYIDPYNSGLNAFGFFVTPVNVQVDMAATNNGMEDGNWNAVWKSATQITDSGWIVEYKIPYSALRFPKTEVQVWGMNCFRNIARYRENTSWSFIDNEKQGWIRQQGVLKGINNVTPPLRLSFTPYLSTYVEKNAENNNWTNFYRAGMDLKYGINESYTLDMMLIPDFGQVQSDEVVLNLSPFEVFYDEKRQFFIEGNELFNRANIFYSRRIGNTPAKYYDVDGQLAENEIVVKNPSQSQMINATKISGRSQGGLGIGYLNAMTTNTVATIKDTISGNERKFQTQPFTNYNVLVFDQTLKNSSYASIINTNYSRFSDGYYANVTGVDFLLNNSSKTYSFSGKGAVNQIFEKNVNNSYGFYSNLNFSKTSGQFRFAISNRIESDTYNPNSMGFNSNPNEISTNVRFSYYIFKPFGRFLRMFNNVNFWHQSLYNPYNYTDFRINLNTNTTFKNYLSVGYFASISPIGSHDYFEARVPNRLFIRPAGIYFETWFSSDFRKKIAVELSLGGSPTNSYNQNQFSVGFEPRYKPNDRLLFIVGTNFTDKYNDLGYVSNNENQDTIYFGRRNVLEFENKIETRYIFNENASLTFNLRHYWSTVEYFNFYTLNQEGRLNPDDSYSENSNINFNYFTVDLAYRWIFAPGSELSFVWKNSINSSTSEVEHSYFNNFSNTITLPQTNSFSLRILYYLDSQYFRKSRA